MHTTPRTILRALPLALLALSVRASAEPPKTFKLEGNQLELPGQIEFETAKDTLKPASDPALQHVADYLAEKSFISLMRVEVHADSAGDPKEAQALTEKRALAVARWLIGHGVDCKRLLPVGFGSTKPVAANDTPENRAKNRRTVFINAALRGRPIGGMPVDGGGRVAGDPCK